MEHEKSHLRAIPGRYAQAKGRQYVSASERTVARRVFLVANQVSLFKSSVVGFS